MEFASLTMEYASMPWIKKEPVPAPEPDNGGLLATMLAMPDGAPELAIRAEMMGWESYFAERPVPGPKEKALCFVSHVFRDLIRQCVQHDKDEDSEWMFSLTRLWELAGSPENARPLEYAQVVFKNADDHSFHCMYERKLEDRDEDED